MNVLGISAGYHDSAAALLIDGRAVAAAQQERFSRIKNDPAFPIDAVAYCLETARLRSADLDAVIFYDKPLVKFERLLQTALIRAPRGLQLFRQAMPGWLREKLWLPGTLRKQLPGAKEYLFCSHHQSHAASAFYPSPFERAAVLTVDGVGEWATCSIGTGNGTELTLLEELQFPHSLGLLYSTFTAYLGFRVNEGEYKLMGLAPYGKPIYCETIYQQLLQRSEDGSFALNLDFFAFADRLQMYNQRFCRLFAGPARCPDGPLEQRHLDLAASIQQVAEELLLGLVQRTYRQTGEKNLCLAGGVALNCVANGRIVREGPFENIWIQPAAGDAGGALGAAYVAQLALGGDLPQKAAADLMQGALLGPQFSEAEMQAALAESGVSYVRMSEAALLQRTAQALADGAVCGWFQGRMEFGPRALGNRSILADPRRAQMQSQLNQKIKFREGFRPFAPAVLHERCEEFFELDRPSPYMLLVAQIAAKQQVAVIAEGEGLARLGVVRSTIPAVTHVDNSARVQTVSADSNPRFHRLLKVFAQRTGCPLLVNTSFNVRDEPLVCTPTDAVNCYLGSGMDALALGPFWVEKQQ